ncbi:hypothetical protein K469DRAFT_713107 [Zopfia rhizophila CBS 207.26]|uniref:RING-type domain-containing protein n=1 Tax=Zopfia rhizophila CBS 207.26 TaxID=1314779 RepID=A0A6A6DUX1_9PEZI|nr:hypothetical protein K469DRAFT_713107 [Zopfia rhizophila CBS 207.26]
MSDPDSLYHHHHPSFTHTANRPITFQVNFPFYNVETSFASPEPPDNSANDSYFEEAIAHRSTPSPPSFLDNILNPPEPHVNDGDLPFGYYHVSSPQRRPRSPVLPAASAPNPPTYIMPPVSQRTLRPSRLPNGYVDLTSEPDPTEDVLPQRRSRKRRTPTPGPSNKRQKRNDGTSTDRATQTPETKIEEIDLSDDKPLQDILQKQRAEAVKAQQRPDEKPTTLTNFNCVICMDSPTDMTATACGHLFCHTCLMEALIAGENRSGPTEPKRSQCPVCRKFLRREKTHTDIIPLLMKKGLATQPRKSSTASTPKV